MYERAHNWLTEYPVKLSCRAVLAVQECTTFGCCFTGQVYGSFPFLCGTELALVLWHCRFGVRKSIQAVKIEWWGVDVVSEVQIVCIWSSWCHCHLFVCGTCVGIGELTTRLLSSGILCLMKKWMRLGHQHLNIDPKHGWLPSGPFHYQFLKKVKVRCAIPNEKCRLGASLL